MSSRPHQNTTPPNAQGIKRFVSTVEEKLMKRRKTFDSCSSALVEKGSTAQRSDSQTAKMPSGPTKGWAQYIAFTEEAQIGNFGPALFPIPVRGKPYNDDVVLPLYDDAWRSYAGTQRRGIRDEHPNATSVHEHITEALQAPFFLAQSTPLPVSTGRAIDFLATSRPTSAKAFWPKQLARLERICDEQRGLTAQWGACRPEELEPLKSANVLLLAFLSHRYKLWGAGAGSNS